MATVRPQDAICRIVEHRILELETKADRTPVYNGVLMIDGMLIVIDWNERNLEIYKGHDGKLITSHRLESIPSDVCLINKNEVAVCLVNGTVVILSLKSIEDVKLVKTLKTGFFPCHSLAKWNSDKLVVSGMSYGMLCWGILSITDRRMDSTHDICKGYWTRMAVKDNTLYISCRTDDSINRGVYVYDLSNPQTLKFLYQHQELERPSSIMADRDYVYVCDWDSNRIHQLTDSGQLVTMHTVSSRLYKIFYDDQHGLLYTTSNGSNVITVYKMESLHQPDSVIPAEVLKMDTRSHQMYKKALNEGREKVYNIRVMVVGQYGVGKTTLTQRLLGKNVNISERHSTDGIDVHIECSKVSLSTGEWTTQDKNAEKYSKLQRLVKLLNERVHNQESEGKQERHVEMVDMVISSEHENGHSQHDHLVSAENNISQINVPPPSQPVQSPIARVEQESNSETGANKNEKDTVMEILQLINENSGKLQKSMVEYAALTLWDFAGQSVFYTTHQTFLTRRAIYLLVIDLSQQITDLIKDDECFLDVEGIKLYKVHDFIEIWLNSVHSCEPASQPGIPPVILVGTHVDRIPEKFRQEAILKYFRKIRQMLKNKPIVLHLMDSIALDNSQCDPKLDDLKRRIFELASKQSYWGEEKPARWIPLEQTIMTLKVSSVKVVPLRLIEEIDRSASVGIKDRDELELFLIFQHEIGTILYFSAEGLREKIVLDPQWMIDALSSLITAEMFIDQNPAIIKPWYAFREKGKLTHELIDAVWNKEEKPDFYDNKEHIILVMEKLNIIARPMSYTEDGQSVKIKLILKHSNEHVIHTTNSEEEDYYLAPCMLRQSTPKGVICPKSDPENESTSVLCYVCKGKFLPTPIFHRLVGACLTRWPIAKMGSENQIYCGCCVFDLDHHHTLTLHFFGHVIFARAIGMGVTDTSQSSKLCTEARKFIFESLLKITRNLGQSLQFEMHIQCPNCDADNTEGLLAVPFLQKHEKVVCRSHDERHTLVSQKLLRLWFEDGEQTVMGGIEEGKESKVSKKEEDASMDRVSSTSIKKGVPCSNPFLLCQLLQKSQQAASSSQSTLEANCLSVGLEVHGATPADGNCFFEAVSSQLRRLNGVVQKSPQRLRQEVVTFMRTNRVIQLSEGTLHLDSFIYNESFDVYCSRMARDGEWADHVVVVAMARMLQIDIMIVTSSPLSGPEDIIVWVVGQTAFQGDPILLGHVWESHYMSLQPIAPIFLDQDLAGHYAQAQTDVPTSAPTTHIMQIPASGPTSSTAVGLIQAPTNNASPSISHGSTSSTTPNCKTSDVLQISISNFATIDAMQAPISESTTADMQIPVPTYTTADVMQFLTSPSTLSTHINGLVQAPTTGSTPSLISTTDGVMQTATPSYIRTDLLQASAFGSTTAVIQAPSSVPTTSILLATISASTPSTAISSTPCQTPTSATAVFMQAPSSMSTTTDIMQASASGTKLSTITGSSPCPTSTSTIANVIQTPTSGSTTNIMQASSSDSTTNAMQDPASGSTVANVMQTPTSGSTAANVIQTPTSGSIAANVMQTPTSGSTAANVIQTPTSGSAAANVIQAQTSGSTAANVTQTPTSRSTAANVIQAPASGSTAANVIQTPTSGSTSANVIQTPTSGSIAANVTQTPTSGSTASGSKPSTTAGPMPVLSSCYTTGGMQTQASSSIQSTTADVTQTPSLDDTGRFVHIACLLVNVGSKVLRRLLHFHTVTPTCTLDQYLAKKRIDIDNLRKRKILNKSQMDIMFPPGGSTNLGDYDITLLSALFTNVVLTISQQDLNMIQLLRDKRNEIFAHAKSVTVNSNDYQTFWNDIRRTLEVLSKQCNDPDFENEISREIQSIQVSTVQGTSLLNAQQTHIKMETLEKLLQYLMSSHAQESNKESDDSDS